MGKKYLSSALVVLLLNLAFYSTAAADTDQNTKQADKIKAGIIKIGADRNSIIEIKLKDGTKLKGYLSAIKDSGVVFRNDVTGMEVEIPYSQIRQVKKDKDSHNSGVVIALKVVLIIGLLGILGGGLSDGF